MVTFQRNYNILTQPLWDEGAEMAVLGSLLLEGSPHLAIGGIAAQVFAILKASDFHRDRHKMIASACLALHQAKTPLDMITVGAELRRRGKLEACGGPEYLAHCIAQTPTSIHALYYAKIVEHWAEERAKVTGLRRAVSPPGYHGLK